MWLLVNLLGKPYYLFWFGTCPAMISFQIYVTHTSLVSAIPECRKVYTHTRKRRGISRLTLVPHTCRARSKPGIITTDWVEP